MKRYYFTRVKNTEYDKEGTVDEWLDQQFTVNYDDGSMGFLMHKDRNVSWMPLDEPGKDALAKMAKQTTLNKKSFQHWAMIQAEATTDEATQQAINEMLNPVPQHAAVDMDPEDDIEPEEF